MNVDSRILDLLEKWEETEANGAPVDPTLLAGGDVQLAAQLRRYVASLRRFNSLKRDTQAESDLHLPTPQELGSSLLLPEGLQLATLQANLTKADIVDAEELKKELQAQPAKNVFQLCDLLLTTKLLTRFQLRAIARGHTRGLKLGRYIVLDRIGAGGMGQVFQAWHSKMGRVVAVKVIHGQAKNKEKALARFYQEVQASAQLRHINIVTAFDADEADGVHFLVMEYVPGKDLNAIVRKEGPLPVTKAVDYMIQAARGLEYAHGVGLLHRDIKPANLLIDETGVLKILDMGIARLSTGDDDQGGLTQEGSVMGTVDYMPPEQAVSSKTVKPQADIYSLGCSFHFMLTGRPPFEGGELMVKLLAHREQAPPSLSQVRSDVPPELDAIYTKCLAKRPSDRYQSATELIADLEKVRPLLRDDAKVAIGLMVSEVEADTSPTSLLATQLEEEGSLIAAPHLQLSSTPKKRRQQTSAAGGGSVGFYGGIAGVALLLLICGYFGWGAMFHVSTPLGNLIVSVDGKDFEAHLRDHQIEVVNTKTGETVTIELASIKQTKLLPPGEYKFSIETSGGMKTDVSQLTITSGESSQVQVYWESPAAVKVASAAVDQPEMGATIADQVFSGHTNAVACVQFTPDGKRLVSASNGDHHTNQGRVRYHVAGSDNSIRVWNIKTGDEVRHFPMTNGHRYGPQSISISSDSRLVAAGAGWRWANGPSEPFVYVWDLSSGQIRYQLNVPGNHAMRTVDFSPDGAELYAVRSGPGGLQSWSVADGQRLADITLQGPQAGETPRMTFSPDSRFIFSGSRKGNGDFDAWDRRSGELIRTFHGHAGAVIEVVMTPDGKKLLSCAEDYSIRLWNWETGDERLRIDGLDSTPTCLAVSPDGGQFAAGTKDGAVILYETATGKELARVKKHTEIVNDVAFSPSGQLVASASDDQMVRLWTLPKASLK